MVRGSLAGISTQRPSRSLRRFGWPGMPPTVRLRRRSLLQRIGMTVGCQAFCIAGFAWTIRQEASLALRHWWPATLITSIFSSSMRRVIVTSLVVDSAAALLETQGRRSAIGPVSLLLGRRLDDLAYGAGLWLGAVRERSTRACGCAGRAELRGPLKVWPCRHPPAAPPRKRSVRPATRSTRWPPRRLRAPERAT